MVFSTTEHNTASTHGAATLVVSAEELTLLGGYMKIHMPPMFATSAQHVFINYTRRQMRQSYYSREQILGYLLPYDGVKYLIKDQSVIDSE